MASSSSVESEKFLKCLGKPFQSCFCCCSLSLKNGLYIIAAIDFLVFCFGVVSLAPLPNEESDASYYEHMFTDIFYIGMGISAFFGVLGMCKVKILWIQQYYYMKLLEALVFIQAVLIGMFLDPEVNEVDNIVGVRIGIVVFMCVVVLLILLMAKVLWSIVVRLQHNQKHLVLSREAEEMVQTYPEKDQEGRPKPTV